MVCPVRVCNCCVAKGVRGNLKESTNAAVDEKIKSWLRHARDRDGGRKRRYAAAAARHSAVPVTSASRHSSAA